MNSKQLIERIFCGNQRKTNISESVNSIHNFDEGFVFFLSIYLLTTTKSEIIINNIIFLGYFESMFNC